MIYSFANENTVERDDHLIELLIGCYHNSTKPAGKPNRPAWKEDVQARCLSKLKSLSDPCLPFTI